MDKKAKTLITVETVVNAPIDTVWKKWTNPDDIVKWNNASDDWHTTRAENENPIAMQQSGWQSILDNFKKYTESKL